MSLMAFSCLTLQISQYEKQKQDAFGQLEEVSVIDIIQSVLYTVEHTKEERGPTDLSYSRHGMYRAGLCN